ncbi:MAG TPA: polysaccharide deacetylase family protein [Bryobacteraceae bacterium]|nr:polysaccharide deacetylase family protein [Bryobacteraceae bacterium]
MTQLEAVLATGAAGATVAAGVLAYAVRAPRSSLLAPSVYKGVTTRRAIALTFDDGPSESTSELLELLAAHRAPATFFQCGVNVRRLPEVARHVAAAGHEIGNHTNSHPMLHCKSPQFIYGELAAAQGIIEETTGAHPTLFRAPFGVRWFGLRGAQQRLGLTGVMWSTLALDWKWPRERVVRRLLQGASNGAIFCLHDGRQLQIRPNVNVMLETVRELLPELMKRGFHFERVSEILCPTKN